jgi:hypothetical protein
VPIVPVLPVPVVPVLVPVPVVPPCMLPLIDALSVPTAPPAVPVVVPLLPLPLLQAAMSIAEQPTTANRAIRTFFILSPEKGLVTGGQSKKCTRALPAIATER